MYNIYLLIDSTHGLHVGLAPLSTQVFGLHLEQLQHIQLHHGVLHLCVGHIIIFNIIIIIVIINSHFSWGVVFKGWESKVPNAWASCHKKKNRVVTFIHVINYMTTQTIRLQRRQNS